MPARNGKPSSVMGCTCNADLKGNSQSAQFQDAVYGSNRRVHTLSPSGKGRCTVCGTARNLVAVEAIKVAVKPAKAKPEPTKPAKPTK